MRVLGIVLFVLLFGSQYSSLNAQDVVVSASLDTNAMLIGDHVGLTLKFTGPAKSQVLWPFIPDTILGNISVIGRGKIDTSFSADKKSVTFSQEINVTCYDSGFYTIPQIPFQYRILPDTSRLTSLGSLLLLSVHTVKVDTTQAIKPIIGPLKVPLTFREMLPWILIGLAAVLLGLFLLWYIKKRRQQQPVLQFKPKVVQPPHVIALQELEKLRLKKMWQSGQIKEYYSELTEILRKYIEDRFQVPAPEQTTAEIMESLTPNPLLSQTVLKELQALLIQADMVKFAKALPMASENESSLVEAISFVQNAEGSAVVKPQLPS